MTVVDVSHLSPLQSGAKRWLQTCILKPSQTIIHVIFLRTNA